MANKKKRPPQPATTKKTSSSSTTRSNGGTARQAATQRQRSGSSSRNQRTQMSATTSWVVLGCGIVFVVVGALFFAIRSQADTGSGEVADDASSWDLPALDDGGDVDGDGRVTLAEFEGRPTVVNFFASWCIECNRELPAFRTLADQYRDDIDFVFVNSNETGNWRPMASEHDILEFPLVQDIGASGNRLYLALGGTVGMPITAFYDADGNHVFTNPGAMNISTITSTLDELGLLPS